MPVFKLGGPTAPLTLTILVLLPGAARAQNIPSPYRFVEESQEGGIFLGWLGANRGEFDLGPAPGPIMGLQYAIRVGGPISLEATSFFVPTTRDVIDPDREEGQRKIGEADVLLAGIHGALKFSLIGERTWNDLTPYVTAGAGFVFDARGEQQADRLLGVDDRFDFGSTFLGVLGLGTRWIPGGRIAFRADLDLHLWQLDTPRGFRLIDRFPNAPESEWVSGLSFSLGGSYLF